MEPGDSVKLKANVRSQKTGMVLPRQGKLIQITENLGRTLLLVAFGNGNSEYLFEQEVERLSERPAEAVNQIGYDGSRAKY